MLMGDEDCTCDWISVSYQPSVPKTARWVGKRREMGTEANVWVNVTLLNTAEIMASDDCIVSWVKSQNNVPAMPRGGALTSYFDYEQIASQAEVDKFFIMPPSCQLPVQKYKKGVPTKTHRHTIIH